MMKISGVISVNKPPGLTSYDVIRVLKLYLKGYKIGHAGTLDPFARGVLLILLNQSTKLFQKFLKLKKKYTAVIEIGRRTETADRTGKEIGRNCKIFFKEKTVLKALKSFVGNYWQYPHLYSAVKLKGKKLYEYARAGCKNINISPKLVTIYNINFKSLTHSEDFYYLEIDVVCGKGTYIRVLAEDIGFRLGYFANLADLTRVSIGEFGITKSVDIETLKLYLGNNKLKDVIIPHELCQTYLQ